MMYEISTMSEIGLLTVVASVGFLLARLKGGKPFPAAFVLVMKKEKIASSVLLAGCIVLFLGTFIH